MQGKYVLSEIEVQLQKAYYVDNAISETQYTDLLNYAKEHIDPNYVPNKTLKELQQENENLRTIIKQLDELLKQQTTVNEEQDMMILDIVDNII